MQLANIFCDNMVFQAEKPIRFFGEGRGTVEITLKNNTYKESFFGDTWEMELPPQPYGGVFEILVRLQEERIVLKNVAFGDVFLCAGQSNMQFSIGEETGATEESDDGNIRYIVSSGMQKARSSGWMICKEGEVSSWSALGLHIAQYYRKKKDVYVGIIGCFQGASVIRSWLPNRALDQDVYLPMEERHADNWHEEYGLWNGDSFLYEKKFLPIIPYSMKGIIWYQGESDTTISEGKIYTELLTRLITSWREDLKDLELPFVVIEICDFDGRNDEGWKVIQDCQQKIVDCCKNVKTVTSKDVCESANIHPANKEKLAEKVSAVLRTF
ncbi:MAG: hypothetical protein IJW58_04570 [Clostridia bacterium]|nr:hypothetical protein [Clostridia bacterium]